jgi:hypothetical protein
MVGNDQFIELEIEFFGRSNSLLLWLYCGKRRTGYDRKLARRFNFVPLWGMKVFIFYAPWRADCPICGIKAEQIS